MGPLRCLTLLAILNASIFSVAQKAPGSTADFLAEKNVAVAMRDGVILRADVMRPKSAGPFPVLVYRTPYGKENALKDYTTFTHAVERGYAVVIQDVRGRYDSAGEFIPYQQEGKDGYDTIEWAAKQPWSNGSIGTFGLSYPGAVQWLAAVESPPHLKAMVPAMTFSSAQNFFYAGGTWDMSWIEWIWDNIAPDARVKRNVPGPKTEKEAEAAWRQDGPKMLRELPLSALAELKGLAPYYYEWLKHPYDDAWWDWCDLRNKYDQVHAAVLNFSGWYDDNYGPEGATTNFTGLLKSRTAQPDPQTHLLVGPWVHGVDSTAKTKSGERRFAPSAAINYDEVVLHWLDHYVRGVSNGVEKERPVRYYV
ncbi:MAG TPA: CocE/NonD family hydrolase, partial [Terriglobales bacterium]|nr:CocE/NonD family hydrolase [Terriglobales bacterium]